MAKVMTAKVKLQCPGGQATPAPPVGPALGQHGVNIGQFVMQFNERTKEMKGTTIPVEITIYSDRTFEFITKSPPAAVLLKQAAGIASGSPEPHKTKVGTVTVRPGPQDRRDQARRPQRPRPRARLPDHRRHRPEHGGRDQGMSREGQACQRDRQATSGWKPDRRACGRHRPVTIPGRHRPPGADHKAGALRSDTYGQAIEAISGLAEKVKTNGPVPLPEAVRLLKTFNTTKFNQTVEVSTHLGIDPKQTDQNVRGSVALPHGIGKSVRVAVFAQGENAEKARAAGADIVGADDLAQQVKGGTMDFDVALATPDMMGVVGPLGRVLGPRGLMPSPRSGTVTTDIASAVREFKAGKIEFRNDKGGNVAVAVGKLAFSEEQLADNINAFLSYLRSLKPAAAKGTYIHSITLSATMSPGIPVSA